jgi:hypothetical protein
MSRGSNEARAESQVYREIFHCTRRIDARRLLAARLIRDGRLYDRNASDPGILRITRSYAGCSRPTMRGTACVSGSGNHRFAAIAGQHYGETVPTPGTADTAAANGPTTATSTIPTAATASPTSTTPTPRTASELIGTDRAWGRYQTRFPAKL